MKKILTLAAVALCIANIADAKKNRKVASNETKCVLSVASKNIPFEVTHEKIEEYLAIEKMEYDGINFKYMEGHGLSRLAAYRGKKLIAATFSSRSIELNLDIGNLQVGCFGLNGLTE